MFVSNVLSNYWRKSSSLAKLPCVLGPCKRTSSVVLVLLLSMPLILWGDFFGHHHEYLFCELITTLCVSLRFGATKVSEVTDRIPGSSQFCIQVTEELHVDCTQSFLSLIVVVFSVEWTFHDGLSVFLVLRNYVSPRKKVWPLGFYPV